MPRCVAGMRILFNKGNQGKLPNTPWLPQSCPKRQEFRVWREYECGINNYYWSSQLEGNGIENLFSLEIFFFGPV